MYDTVLVAGTADYRKSLRKFFTLSYNVFECENGSKAIKKINDSINEVDIIILEISSADTAGFDVLKARNDDEEFRYIPVIAVCSDENIREQAYKLGASDCILQPITKEVVVHRIFNTLNSAKYTAQLIRDMQNVDSENITDGLSGLYNKATVKSFIEGDLKTNAGKLRALMVLNIDNFKSINNRAGNLAGDHTIKIIAGIISSHFRKNDIIGRIGGDEFVVYMRDIPSKEIARGKATDIIRVLKRNPDFSLTMGISMSLGLAFTDECVDNYDSLMCNAMHALKQAKLTGKGQYCEYGIVRSIILDLGKSTVVICSRKFTTCSMITHIFDSGVNVVEVSTVEQLLKTAPDIIGNVTIGYIDVSNEIDGGKSIWEIIRANRILSNVPLVAICRESDMQQIRLACTNDVRDIAVEPLDKETLKRKTLRIVKS